MTTNSSLERTLIPIISIYQTKFSLNLLKLFSPFNESKSIDNIKIRRSDFIINQFNQFHLQFIQSATATSTATPNSTATFTPTTTTALNSNERDELFLNLIEDNLKSNLDTWLSNNQDNDNDNPWYKTTRDAIFNSREMVEYDTFNWPVACLLAISTSDPDPLGALSILWDQTCKDKLYAPRHHPPVGLSPSIRTRPDEDNHKIEWANPELVRYIVLIHDFGAGTGREGWEDAEKLFETIQKTYGHHTALLPLNSASPHAARPEPRAQGISSLWTSASGSSTETNNGLGLSSEASGSNDTAEDIGFGQDLSDNDVKAIKIFLREMVVQSIIPWMERSIVVGNEQYNASKRSIGGRLFSAGRKYFGGSTVTGSRTLSPSTTASPLVYNSVKGFYPFQAQESQSRRLADLAFMVGDYTLAAAVYDSIAKDYKTDHAWKYYASACRMAGLSLLRLHPSNTPLTFDPDIYLEQATQTPLHSSRTVDLDGLRMMMLYYETYKVIKDWRPAPSGLVRTAGDADEVVSALLLEQAAIADLLLPMPSKRKYAFHMAMAAARYEKCGLKSLSRRCLSQAASVYSWRSPRSASSSSVDEDTSYVTSSPWTAIRSHVYHGLGRQAYSSGKPEEAIEHFLELLVGDSNQRSLVGEYDDETNAQGDTEVGGDVSCLEDFTLAWEQLGPRAFEIVTAKKLVFDAPLFSNRHIFVRTSRSNDATDADLNSSEWDDLEKLYIASTTGVTSWSRMGENQVIVGETFHLELLARNPLNAPLAIGGLAIQTSDALHGTVTIQAPQEIELGPRESQRIVIPIRITSLGSFEFPTLSYRFADLLPCSASLASPPLRLTSTREQLQSPTYKERPLMVTARSSIPVLEIEILDLPDRIGHGEEMLIGLRIRNVGGVCAKKLRGIVNRPEMLRLEYERDGGEERKVEKGKRCMKNALSRNEAFDIDLGKNGMLDVGQETIVRMRARGDRVGVVDLKWLFVFEGSDHELLSKRVRRRLVVRASLQIDSTLKSSSAESSLYSLGLEITNATNSGIKITSLTSLSPRFSLSLPDPPSSGIDIESRQSTHLVFDVAPVDLDEASRADIEASDAFVLKKLESLLQGKELGKDLPVDIALYSDHISFSDSPLPDLGPLHQSLSSSRLIFLQSKFPTLKASLLPMLFPLIPTSSLTLLIAYSFPSHEDSRPRSGYTITTIPIGSPSNILTAVLDRAANKSGGIYEESQRERLVLLEGLATSEWGSGRQGEAPGGVEVRIEGGGEGREWNFDQDGPCSIPITFLVRNTSSTAFTYSLRLLSSATSSAVYAGALTYSDIIEPFSSRTISTSLFVSLAGAFEAGECVLGIQNIQGDEWRVEGKGRTLRVRDISRT